MVSFRREVQESLCGLGRNSRSNLGSRSNSRGNTSNSRVNLLASQTNLGSLSSFHSAVTRQVSSIFFCVFFSGTSVTFFSGFLQPSRHCLLVELPQHGHRAGLERHGEFLQHGNIAGLSQPGKSSSEPEQPFLPELGQQGLGGDFGDQHSNTWSGRGGINWPPGHKSYFGSRIF